MEILRVPRDEVGRDLTAKRSDKVYPKKKNGEPANNVPHLKPYFALVQIRRSDYG
jgi:hypothetical protein